MKYHAFPRLALLIVCLLLLYVPSISRAASPSISEDTYWQEIKETLAIVIKMQASPESAGNEELLDKALFWENVTRVALNDDEYILIDTSYLVKQLRKDPPDLKYLNKHLEMLIQAHQKWPEGNWSQDSEDLLTPILSQKEFQWETNQSSRGYEFINKILNKIGQFFSKLFHRVLPENTENEVPVEVNVDPTDIYFGISTLLMIFIAYFVFSQLRGGLVADVGSNKSIGEIEIITSQQAYSRAQESAQSGDNRTAIRYLYLSSLLFLEEHHVLKLDRSKTNREYKLNVSKRPELADIFNHIVETFDNVWYGFHKIDEQTYQSYQDQINELKNRV